jgi:tRNA-modifying protein YgfZ
VPRSFPSNAAAGEGLAPPDYTAARTALAHRLRRTGVLAIEGPDRVDFLQGQLTQDVKTLEAGESRPAAGLTPKGKLIYWGRVLAGPDRILLLIPSDARPAVAAHLSKYAAFQKVTVRDVTHQHLALGLYGPRAREFEPPSGVVVLPEEGEFAVNLLAPRSVESALTQALERAGSRSVEDATAEILRVEAGRPLLGKDADDSNLPEEVGLASAISATKGCYVGQEIVARLRTYGRVNRRLVGFRFPAAPVPEGTTFPNPEKASHEVARVSSAVHSPRFGAIGLGLAFREVAEGATLVDPHHPERLATVAPLPFA